MPIYVALAGAIAPVLSRQCRWGGRDSMEITMFWLSNDSIDGMLLEIMGKFTFVCWCFQHFWFLTLLDFLPSHKEQVILVVRGSQPKTLDQRKYALLVMKKTWINKQCFSSSQGLWKFVVPLRRIQWTGLPAGWAGMDTLVWNDTWIVTVCTPRKSHIYIYIHTIHPDIYHIYIYL